MASELCISVTLYVTMQQIQYKIHRIPQIQGKLWVCVGDDWEAIDCFKCALNMWMYLIDAIILQQLDVVS